MGFYKPPLSQLPYEKKMHDDGWPEVLSLSSVHIDIPVPTPAIGDMDSAENVP